MLWKGSLAFSPLWLSTFGGKGEAGKAMGNSASRSVPGLVGSPEITICVFSPVIWNQGEALIDPVKLSSKATGSWTFVSQIWRAWWEGHVFCADSGCHSLVGLKIVYVQEDTLLLKLCSCVPHWLRPLHPSGFSFSIKFNWSPSISGNIRTDHLAWRWQTQMFLAAQRPGELTPVHPWPPGIEPGQLYIMWSSDNHPCTVRSPTELVKGKLFSMWLKFELQTNMLRNTCTLLSQGYWTTRLHWVTLQAAEVPWNELCTHS